MCNIITSIKFKVLRTVLFQSFNWIFVTAVAELIPIILENPKCMRPRTLIAEKVHISVSHIFFR